MKNKWKVLILLAVFTCQGCMLKVNRKTDTRAEISIPNPICDVIGSLRGQRQTTVPVHFRQTSRTRRNMGPYYGAQ